jgi:hypothetical protein
VKGILGSYPIYAYSGSFQPLTSEKLIIINVNYVKKKNLTEVPSKNYSN